MLQPNVDDNVIQETNGMSSTTWFSHIATYGQW